MERIVPNYNRVVFVGHLTRDPQLKFLPNQTPVVECGIASTRKFKGQGGDDREDTCFVDFSLFGKPAEVLNQYAKKGHPLLIEGRLKYDTWDDKNGSGKRSKLSIVAESFQFLKGKDQGAGDDRQDEPPI